MELLALKGLGSILDTVQVIQTELEINPMYENQCLFNDVDAFLIEKGFYRVTGDTRAQFGADVIYVRR